MSNRIFDFCNSMSPCATGFKSAITAKNLTAKMKVIQESCAYIRSLREPCGKSLLDGRRKTAFLGFLATLQSIDAIANRLLMKNYRFVLTYRLSQKLFLGAFGDGVAGTIIPTPCSSNML